MAMFSVTLNSIVIVMDFPELKNWIIMDFQRPMQGHTEHLSGFPWLSMVCFPWLSRTLYGTEKY